MIAFESLLVPFGFNPEIKTKLVRHQDQRYDVQALIRAGQFDYYQEIQRQRRFSDCQQIFSFVGQPGTHAVFFGVYEVLGVSGPADHQLPDVFLYPEMDRIQHYRYKLRLAPRFAELRSRLVIDWGAGTRSW